MDRLTKLFFEIATREETITHYTGLVFCGYGKSEIYPRMESIKISFAFDGRLRYINNDSVAISDHLESYIQPFAQTDVIDTILTGVAPTLEAVFVQSFEKFLKKYNDSIADQVNVIDAQLADQLRQQDFSNILTEYRDIITRNRFDRYVHPLFRAIESLAREDLAEMAESLIYLTYLKRRMTFQEESVGGPVDVAIISKHDGFIWIKRKHYFNRDLNQHFFKNYFK